MPLDFQPLEKGVGHGLETLEKRVGQLRQCGLPLTSLECVAHLGQVGRRLNPHHQAVGQPDFGSRQPSQGVERLTQVLAAFTGPEKLEGLRPRAALGPHRQPAQQRQRLALEAQRKALKLDHGRTECFEG